MERVPAERPYRESRLVRWDRLERSEHGSGAADRGLGLRFDGCARYSTWTLQDVREVPVMRGEEKWYHGILCPSS